MDIKSKAEYPASALSNFSPHSFLFDGVKCASMEGLLQSFKFDDFIIQQEVCKMYGKKAKEKGKERNKAWKEAQQLWWKGISYDRSGQEYQDLLDRAFEALSANSFFQKALLDSGNEPLKHSIGNPNQSDTCLTEYEFCSRLEKIRKRLQK